MGLFKKKSDETRAASHIDKDSAPLEAGEAAQTPEEVHSRADAAEYAANRRLAEGPIESTQSLGTLDHLEDAESAGEANAGAGKKPGKP